MSYVDEVIEQVVAQNPAEPEFHQAVKEVLAPTCRTFAEDIVNGTAGDSKCVGRINESFRAGKNARL